MCRGSPVSRSQVIFLFPGIIFRQQNRRNPHEQNRNPENRNAPPDPPAVYGRRRRRNVCQLGFGSGGHPLPDLAGPSGRQPDPQTAGKLDFPLQRRRILPVGHRAEGIRRCHRQHRRHKAGGSHRIRRNRLLPGPGLLGPRHHAGSPAGGHGLPVRHRGPQPGLGRTRREQSKIRPRYGKSRDEEGRRPPCLRHQQSGNPRYGGLGRASRRPGAETRKTGRADHSAFCPGG